MSTPQPLPIKATLPANNGTVSAASQGGPLDTGSKGIFGGVLSDELGTAGETAGPTDSAPGLNSTAENFAITLPLDGNSLPLGINKQLQADIAVLNTDINPAVDTSTELVDTLALPLPSSFQLNFPVTTTPADGFGVRLQGSSQLVAEVPKPVDVIRFVHGASSLPVKSEQAIQPVTLPFYSEQGLDAETLAVTQFKQNQQLQNLFSPLSRQADVGIEAGQISRVLEQFSEISQRPASATPAVVSPVGATPLSESGLASTSTGLAQLSVDVPVQDERWQKAFSQRVVWSIGNNQSAQLRIHPAELGRIDIQVNVDNDKASVVFNTQHGMVKDAIEQALPRLREMLAEQGVELDQVDISHSDINQQQAGTDSGSGEEQDPATGLLAGASNNEEQVTDDVIVSQISIAEDVIDYYV